MTTTRRRRKRSENRWAISRSQSCTSADRVSRLVVKPGTKFGNGICDLVMLETELRPSLDRGLTEHRSLHHAASDAVRIRSLADTDAAGAQAERQQRDDAYIDKLKRKQAPQRAPKASPPRAATADAATAAAAGPSRPLPQIPTGPLVRA